MITSDKAARFRQVPLPKQFCNLDRLQRMMADLRLDGLVSSYTMNVFYLTGFYGVQNLHEANGMGIVVIPREKPERAVLIVGDPFLSFFATQPTWVEDVRAFACTYDLGAPLDPAVLQRLVPEPIKKTPRGANMLRSYAETKEGATLQALKDLRIDKSRIGFDNLLTAEAFASTEVQPVNIYYPMVWVRMGKTPAEIEMLRTATKLNQTAIEETIATWQTGMTWRELNRTYNQIARDLGGVVETPVPNAIFNADANDPMAAQPIPLPWHTGLEEDYVLREGANIMFDCHGWWNKYCWDGGKTWIVNDELKGEGKKIADACGDATLEIEAAMAPGIRISQLQALGRTVFRKHGLRSDAPLIFFHGLGLEHNDLEIPPGTERAVQHRIDWVLEKGMLACSHIAYPGELRERYYIEDIALVTDKGGSSLFDWGVKPLVNPR